MQIKYYRLGTGEILPCIEDNGKYYKLFINPNYVIDKCSWENFTETEPLCCPLNMSRPQQRQWYEDNYIDKSNLVGNVQRVVQSYKDVEAMNELLAQGVVTPENEDYEMTITRQSYRTTKKRPKPLTYYVVSKVHYGRVELPLRRVFDTYDEIMDYTVSVQFDDNYCADVFDETPPEMTYYLRALVDAMPNTVQLQWDAPDLKMRTFRKDYYPIYTVPEDWTPDWWRYPSRKAAIDYFLHLNRRRPPKTRDRMLAFIPYLSDRHVFNYIMRPILGRPVVEYIKYRLCEEAKQLKIEHPEMSFGEISDYLHLHEFAASPPLMFSRYNKQAFNTWWDEYCITHGIEKQKQKRKKRKT